MSFDGSDASDASAEHEGDALRSARWADDDGSDGSLDSDERLYGSSDELYDDEADARDAAWAAQQAGGGGGAGGGGVVLCCACCFATLCLQSQPHERHDGQYRALAVTDCVDVDRKHPLKPKHPRGGGGGGGAGGFEARQLDVGRSLDVANALRPKAAAQGGGSAAEAMQTGEGAAGGAAAPAAAPAAVAAPAAEEPAVAAELFFPLSCASCEHKCGVFEPAASVYHFYSVIPSS